MSDFSDDENFAEILSKIPVVDKATVSATTASNAALVISRTKNRIDRIGNESAPNNCTMRCYSDPSKQPLSSVNVATVTTDHSAGVEQRSHSNERGSACMVLHSVNSLAGDKICGEVPVDFQFPFAPYQIQVDLMRALFLTLEQRKIGIFESPTGTGKSLSLICGCLAWFVHNMQRMECSSDASPSNGVCAGDDEPDWVREHRASFEQRGALAENRRMLRAREERLCELRKLRDGRAAPVELKERRRGKKPPTQVNWSAEFCADQLAADDQVDQTSVPADVTDVRAPGPFQIIYCSRTHSQLAQFLGEVRRTAFRECVRVAYIGSRKQLCVNDAVRALANVSMINDKCLQLQRLTAADEPAPKRRKAAGCEFCRAANVQHLRDVYLATMCDRDALLSLGNQLVACPYYAARRAALEADLLLVPYNILLSRSMRQSCGVRLKDAVVIVDEAHNLVEALSAIHSHLLPGPLLTRCLDQLTAYQDKYRARFCPNSARFIQQLVFVLKRFMEFLKPLTSAADASKHSPTELMMTINDFLFELRLDNVNFHEVIDFCERSHLGRKLFGFDTLRRAAADEAPSSPLLQVLEFLAALTVCSDDGRVLVSRAPLLGRSFLKTLLLNPAAHFAEICAHARSVVIAGGTMQPFGLLVDELFLGQPHRPERVVPFTCDHIVPKEHLCVMAVETAASQRLDFTFANRGRRELLDATCGALAQLAACIPAGLVVFVPSYSFMDTFRKHLTGTEWLRAIEQRKTVFYEPATSSQVDDVLEAYALAVSERQSGGGGALLLAVVGGKLSEGINFADELGRGVVMIGMPYASRQSAELQEKMRFLDKHLRVASSAAASAGAQYYENLCMKAVNQCVGRAIRHRNDFSAIVLLDARYQRPAVSAQLSRWVRQSLQLATSLESALADMRNFFAARGYACA